MLRLSGCSVFFSAISLIALLSQTGPASATDAPLSGRSKSSGAKIPFDLGNIFSSPNPGLAFAQALSGSQSPDPRPPSLQADFSSPSALPPALRATILGKTIPFCGAAYCSSVFDTGKWDCGQYCDANPDFELAAAGGDGAVNQRYYVGWNPSTKDIVVARQGADFRQLMSFIYAVSFQPAPLDSRVAQAFSHLADTDAAPSSPSPKLRRLNPSPKADKIALANVVVNSGFQRAWSHGYAAVEDAVGALLRAHPDAARVFVTGHSLGAAIALLDGLALRGSAAVPRAVPVEVSTTGQPRVGGGEFARLVDALVRAPGQGFAYHRVSNHRDVFVHLFPMVMGYEHSMNEVYIPQSGSTRSTPAMLCAGNENAHCADSQSMNVSVSDHPGPYFGTYLASIFCAGSTGTLRTPPAP